MTSICRNYLLWLPLAAATALQSADTGLLFHLPFEGNLVPAAAAGKADGTLEPAKATASFGPGVKGQAAILSEGHLRFAGRDNLNPAQGTVLFWLKPAAWDPSLPSEAWTTMFGAAQFLNYPNAQDTLSFFRYPKTMSNNGLYNFPSTHCGTLDNMMLEMKDWAKDEWRFFALTWDKTGRYRVFVNGGKRCESTRKRDSLPVQLHYFHINASHYYDEFRIYDNPLSERMVAEIYKSEAPPELLAKFPPPPCAVDADAAVDPIMVENNAVRLVFNANSGDLVSMVHKASGLELRPRKDPSAVFALEAVPYVANSILFPNDRIQTLLPDATTCRECKAEGRTLRQRHVFPGGVEVLVTVELPEKGEVSSWRIELDNKPTWHPSRAMIVHRTLFPRLTGLRTDEKPEAMRLAIPQLCGLLVPDPVANLAKMPAYSMAVEPAKSGEEYRVGRYAPGYPSMTWQDLSGPRAGIYLASHDVKPVIATCPESASDQANKEIELSIRRMTITYPGETWKPAPCSVGVHGPEGWHWSADRYREWFYSTVKVRRLPEWIRENCGGLVAGGGGGANFLWEDFPRQIRLGKPYGMAYLQKWQAVGGDDLCEGGGLNTDYANFPVPNPYCGSFKKFEAAMKEVHKLGGRVGFYKNLPKTDAVLGKFIRQPRYLQKIPKGTPMLDENPFANSWTDCCQISSEGGFHSGSAPYSNHLDGLWWYCVGAKTWVDFTCDWSKRWNREYGLDAIYLDSCGPAAMRACFNPRHGLDKPYGRPHDQAQLTVDLYRRLAKEADSDFGLLQEFVWDRLMENGTHSLATFSYSGNGNPAFSEPAIFRYVHPRFPLYCGTGLWPMVADVLGGALPKPTIPEYFGYIYLYGGRFMHWGAEECLALDYPPELMSDEMKELRAVFSLRHAVREDMNNDDFRDTIGLGKLPDRVFSRVYARQDRSAAMLTLFDLREKREAFTVELDMKAHGMKNAVKAELVKGWTTTALATPVMKGNTAVVTIPADAGKMAAIRIFAE